MIRRVLRRAGRALLVLALLLAIAAAGALGVLGTRTGSAWLLREGLARSGMDARVDRVEGTLLHRLQLGGLDVVRDGTRVRVDRLVLEWRPAELLGGRVHVVELGVHGVDVTSPPAPSPPGREPLRLQVPELPALSLPVAVQVDRVELTAVRPDGAGGPVALERAVLALAGEGRSLGVSSLDLTARGYRVLGAVTVTAGNQDWPVNGELALTGGDAGTPVDVRVRLSGSVRAPRLALEGSAPVAASGRLEADLRSDPPAASLDLEWRDASLAAVAPLASPQGSLHATTRDLGFELRLDARLEGAPAGIRRTTVTAGGTLGALAAPWPLEARLDWGLDTAAAAFSGQGRLSGSLRELILEHTLGSPFHVTTAGTVAPDGAATRVDLSGEWRDLAWPPGPSAGAPASPSGRYRLAGTLADLEAHLQAALRNAGGIHTVQVDLKGGARTQAPHPFQGNVSWQARTDLAGTLHGEGTLSGDAHQLRFEHHLTAPESTEVVDTQHPASRRPEVVDTHDPATVDTRGRVTLAPALDLDVSGEFRGLRWPLRGEPTVDVGQGRFALRGAPDALATTLDASASTAAAGPVTVHASATVSETRARDLALRAGVLGGSVDARGQATWADGVDVTLAIAARDLDPARLHPQATGRLGTHLDLALSTASGHTRGRVELHDLEGTLGGHPVRGEGQVTFDDGAVNARRLLLRTGDNSLTVSGGVGQTLSLDYRLDAPDLAQLWPGLAGSVKGEGQLRGDVTAPVVKASLDARGLRAGDAHLARASLQADVDLSRGAHSAVHVRATDLAAGVAAIASARLDLEGTPERHRLELEASASEGRLTVHARGGVHDDHSWSGEVGRLDILATPLGDWRLETPVTLRASAGGADSGEACLASDGARLCVQSRRPRDQGQNVDLRLSALPVSRFSPWLPRGLHVTGALDAEAQAHRQGGQPWEATATVTATPTRLELEEAAAGAPLALSLDDTRVEARHDAQGTVAELSSRVAGDGSLQARVKLRPHGTGTPALEGRVNASVPDLAPFHALVPMLGDLAGRLQAAVDLAGTVDRPVVRGSVSLLDGHASVAAAGITLEHTSLTLSADEAGGFSVQGETRSGPGSITLAGDGRLDDAGISARITARGKNFEAVKLLPVHALVSPDLVLDARSGHLGVTGTLQVPEATVTIKEVPPDVVAVSDDETIVGRTREPTSTWRRELDVKVDLTFGDKVHVSAFGLDTDLTGALAIAVAGASPPTARGTVSLRDGRFKAYGQDLQVQRGRLLFAGPLDNPGLDFRAVRDAGEVVAGIEVSGSADRMRSRVFSEPPLPQAEALSWLFTGRALSGASSNDGATLAGAAVALGLEGGDQVTRQIGSKLGLDELSVAPGDKLDESALVLGKSLTPRLYIRYALGVLDRQGSVQLDYKVTDHVSVEAQSGASQGADLLYRLER